MRQSKFGLHFILAQTWPAAKFRLARTLGIIVATKRTSPYSPKLIDAALQVEYYHLQKTIEDFDARAIAIKTWSVTFGLASLVGAFTSKANLVFLLAAAGGSLFWLLEAFWKAFQLGYYTRIEQLEQHFRGGDEVEFPNQVSSTWQSWWESESWWVLGRTAIWVHVALPHAFIVISGILAYYMVTFPPSAK